jgi:hypothetical protein
MLSASIAEVVRDTSAWPQEGNVLTIHAKLVVEGSVSRQGSDRGHQDTITDVIIWRSG